MSKFDENLFGRIAILSNCLSREQFDECVQVQAAMPEKGFLGQILLERGYLTEPQLERILDIRRRKILKLTRSQADAREADRELVELVLRHGLLELGELEDAVLEQKRLRQLNLHLSLCEVLVSRGKLELGRALDLLAEQGRMLLRCVACERHFAAGGAREARNHGCRTCGGELTSPLFLDAAMTDGALEVESETEHAGSKP
jgi:hypothetical protein